MVSSAIVQGLTGTRAEFDNRPAVTTRYRTCRMAVRLALEDRARTEGTPVLEYHAEDEDEDLLMSDIAVLGRTYVLRLRMGSLRSVRSPSGSSIGGPSSKRRQHHPPRPENFAIQVAVLQAAKAERERTEAATAQHLQQRQAEVDAKLEAERAAWTAKAQQGLEDVERKLKVLEVVREEERVTARNIQEFQAGQIRDLRASSAQVQADYATADPKPATTMRANSGDHKLATMSQGGIMGKGTGDHSQPGLKNVPRTVLDQLRATLPEADFARIAGSVGPKEIKTEIHASAAAAGADEPKHLDLRR
ncbi:Hypothetical protein PHPALM_1810 [Phytophthora palmivora]|uniref:Uncharacterized protein n=1 Tax=Phytophthora palmivora TaxID=4796 RepID=A0A2P4YRC5_9STRA|nr:Hypothetical protein PHPALM_1810 [Phytophthora palmivora]